MKEFHLSKKDSTLVKTVLKVHTCCMLLSQPSLAKSLIEDVVEVIAEKHGFKPETVKPDPEKEDVLYAEPVEQSQPSNPA